MIDLSLLKGAIIERELKILSYDSINSVSIVDKEEKWFDMDSLSFSDLCTFDSIYFQNGVLIFAEFKNSKPKYKDFLMNLKLKFHETLACLHRKFNPLNPLFNFSILISTQKKFYYVFSNTKCTPTDLIQYRMRNRIWANQYQQIYNCKIYFVDNVEFESIFSL